MHEGILRTKRLVFVVIKVHVSEHWGKRDHKRCCESVFVFCVNLLILSLDQ